MYKFLERCVDTGICLNREKLEYKCKAVPYADHWPKHRSCKIQAIVDIPAQMNRHGFQRLIAMLNYKQKFAPDFSNLTALISNLLSEEVKLIWDSEIQGVCFEKVKQLITNSANLRYFASLLFVVFYCDACPKVGGFTRVLRFTTPVIYWPPWYE